MAVPQYIRVWLEDGTVYVAQGTRVIEAGAPNSWSTKTTRVGDMYPSNDRIWLYKYGRVVISDKEVDFFADKDNNQISPKPIVNYQLVIDYFHSLGIDQNAGGTENVQTVNGIEPINGNVTLPLPYATLTQYNALAARVLALEQAAEYIQLDTPVPVVSNITQTGATITWDAIPNAESYEVLDDNGDLIANVTNPTYTFTGLTAGTPYQGGVMAKGILPYVNSEVGGYSFTTQSAQTQLSAPVPVASGITANSITISSPAVANAQLYRFIRNGQVITTQASPSYTHTGLSPSTNYTFGMIAIANGYIDSPVGQVNATTQAGVDPDPVTWVQPGYYAPYYVN